MPSARAVPPTWPASHAVRRPLPAAISPRRVRVTGTPQAEGEVVTAAPGARPGCPTPAYGGSLGPRTDYGEGSGTAVGCLGWYRPT